MSKLSHRGGSERYAACSDDAANTAVGNGCGTDTARVLRSFGMDRICWGCFA